MNQSQVKVLTNVLEQSLQITLREASMIKEEDRFLQLTPGKGHPMWLLGHLASSCDMVGARWILGMSNQLEEAFRHKFAPDFLQGDPIVPSPENYPDWSEITATYERTMRRFIDSFGALTDEDLQSPVRGDLPERLKERIPNMLMGGTMMILHDSHHRGQMALIGHMNQ